MVNYLLVTNVTYHVSTNWIIVIRREKIHLSSVEFIDDYLRFRALNSFNVCLIMNLITCSTISLVELCVPSACAGWITEIRLVWESWVRVKMRTYRRQIRMVNSPHHDPHQQWYRPICPCNSNANAQILNCRRGLWMSRWSKQEEVNKWEGSSCKHFFW